MRGIYQGDPISLYFYLICVEGLSFLLNDAKTSSNIKRVKVARGCPIINHLFFADDNIIFCRANTNKWQVVQSLLDTYKAASDQRINKHKTRIFFNLNTSNTKKVHFLELADVSSSLGCTCMDELGVLVSHLVPVTFCLLLPFDIFLF